MYQAQTDNQRAGFTRFQTALKMLMWSFDTPCYQYSSGVAGRIVDLSTGEVVCTLYK